MKHLFTVILLASSWLSYGQKWPMRNDSNFDASVSDPAFVQNEGPKILLDGGHHNFFIKEGFIKPLEQVAKADGFQPIIDSAKFTTPYLKKFDIVIIITALPFDFTTKTSVTNESTFTNSEINHLYQWVNDGGSLLVFSEHAPFDQAINPLLRKFGLESSVGYVIDSLNFDPKGHPGWIKFSKDNGLLNQNHPITQGRNEELKVTRVMTYGGSALRGKGYDNIFRLAASSQIIEHHTGVGPEGSGNSQCLAAKIGKGKVVAFGDSNGFTAMLFDSDNDESSCGMSDKDYEWKKLVRNVLYWLSN
ncbi:hypothetical protein [Reichenbachiella sp.]|uniref:hypothetical protein n=1 Tax=Reichenbachiella sp. TaxID=2184521 RepID=UPI003B5994E1